MTPYDDLAKRATKLGIELTDDQRSVLAKYVALLMRWNRAYNLTSARSERELIDRHILDSLILHPYMTSGPFVDLGSGAGFPGIPLAVVQPERSVTLLDRNGKKACFLRQCATELGLSRVRVRKGRMEDLPTGGYAVATARALAPLSTLVPVARRILLPGGVLLAPKGDRLEGELGMLPEAARDSLEAWELTALGASGRAYRVRLIVPDYSA